jgi:hypothetical protein
VEPVSWVQIYDTADQIWRYGDVDFTGGLKEKCDGYTQEKETRVNGESDNFLDSVCKWVSWIFN